MCQEPTPRTRSIQTLGLGPATLALERTQKRRRVSNEREEVSSVGCLVDLYASLVQSNEEEAFPTIAWVFDDE